MRHRTIGSATGSPELAGRDAPVGSATSATSTPRPQWAWLVARAVGAIAVLTAGIVHFQLWLGSYGAIPTIGPLFLVHAIVALLVAAALLAPIEHLAGRHAGLVVALVSLGGIALAVTSLTLEYVSERRPIFGFQEPGYDPGAIALSRDAELVATAALAASLVGRFAWHRRTRRW